MIARYLRRRIGRRRYQSLCEAMFLWTIIALVLAIPVLFALGRVHRG